MVDRAPNRLSREASPYLRQHARNPVDWFPWGDEAFERARRLDRPVFLSVGYAACHWCHVMERESFEDEETAALLNERFIAVKVDREERPDVDGIYMDAVQAMTGQGGWPMSVWLTPDGRPFYAGTYFPDRPRRGMPSFRQVLEALAETWATRRDEIEAQATRVLSSIASATDFSGSGTPITEAIAERALTRLRESFDQRWGGFGSAPKFPQPMVVDLVLRMAARVLPDAREMAVLTLDRMADGGIHDQVGGGFARYSTDEAWHVPHFEKMLYDNAQLASVYVHAWLLTGNERYREVTSSTLDYLLREMRHPDGAFYSSQDADSEGAEGRFFSWRWQELTELIEEPLARVFGATPDGNWEGTNVLWLPVPLSEVADRLGIDRDELELRVANARRTLFEARERRVRPGTDDKVVTAWNALAIRALCEAGRALGDRAYVDAAERCAVFLWERCRDDTGRLRRSWRDNVPGPSGFADDHALTASAFLTLYETIGDPTWFVRARQLADTLIDLFVDDHRGGFFQTGRDAEPLLVRPKDLQDNAVPSGNSAAAEALLRLSLLTGDADYELRALSALQLVVDLMERAPSGFGTALCALDLYVGPAQEVAIIGEAGAPSTDALIREVVATRFLPNVVLAWATPGDTDAAAHVPLLVGRTQTDGLPTAYVCEGFSCRAPVTDAAELARLLG